MLLYMIYRVDNRIDILLLAEKFLKLAYEVVLYINMRYTKRCEMNSLDILPCS
jgi:hypothetical protein